MTAETKIDDSTLHAMRLAQCLKAAGDVLRLQILRSLAQDSFAVLELAQIFGIKQNAISHHLKVLSSACLLTTRREGNTIFYRRNDGELNATLSQVHQAVFHAADSISLSAEQNQNLHAIHDQRAQASHAFFVRHINDFQEQQELIAAYKVYGPEVAQLLESAVSGPSSRRHKALELGPGAGEFLPELAQYFEQVVALDSSRAMLDKAKKRGEEHALSNIHFVHADTHYCRENAEQFDCVVINMVLHHTPSPSTVIADIVTSMCPGASLIICDLATHDQDWVREACGDQWLGFDPNDLKKWATDSGLQEGINRCIALRNGFQVHIHHFTKSHH